MISGWDRSALAMGSAYMISGACWADGSFLFILFALFLRCAVPLKRVAIWHLALLAQIFRKASSVTEKLNANIRKTFFPIPSPM